MKIDFFTDTRKRAIDAVRAALTPKDAYYVRTLGCQQNEADSERLRGMAEAMGYHAAERPEDATLIVINTCAIRGHAEERALSLVGRYKQLKKSNPSLVIALCGCMANEPATVRVIKEKFPYVSFTLEPNMLHRFPELVATAVLEHRRSFLFGEDVGDVAEGMPVVRTQAHRAWVSIMYGCNNFCSYCIVPYVRGRERSRDAEAVLDECRALIADGCREITLLGQNVNSYASTLSFPALLEAIASIEGEFRLRFMTSHPKDVSDELIRVMAAHRDKIAPAFHLPMQSGNDRILRAMNRTYTRAHYLGIVEKLRAAIPDITLTTDVIVAFPSETDEEFEDTVSLVREVGFDSLFSFIYSPREGTVAARRCDLIPPEDVVKTRMERLIALSHDLSLLKNEAYVGRVERVLIDTPDREGGSMGRTDGGKLVHVEGADLPVGHFVHVRIDRATPYDLFGTRV